MMPPAGYAEIRAQLPAIEGLNSVRGLMRHLRFAAGADRGERFAKRPYPASA